MATCAGGAAGSPYKALLAYDIQDAGSVYGRSDAIIQGLEHIASGRLTVLHAESGVGKTSLARAGILPRLLAGGQLPIYLRPYTTPVPLAVKRGLLPELETAPRLANASLNDFLRVLPHSWRAVSSSSSWTRLKSSLPCSNPPRVQRSLKNELAGCLDDPALPARWVLALRGQWLSSARHLPAAGPESIRQRDAAAIA